LSQPSISLPDDNFFAGKKETVYIKDCEPFKKAKLIMGTKHKISIIIKAWICPIVMEHYCNQGYFYQNTKKQIRNRANNQNLF
jgi:hypothetical protein